MSTRAQILVLDDELPKVIAEKWTDSILLYRHCDGYPTSVLPGLKKALENAGKTHKASRAGYSASYIIHESYSTFENYRGETTPDIAIQPLSYFSLHSDIRYFYSVLVVSDDEENPDWFVDVYRRDEGFKGGEITPELKGLKKIGSGLISKIGEEEEAKRIESKN